LLAVKARPERRRLIMARCVALIEIEVDGSEGSVSELHRLEITGICFIVISAAASFLSRRKFATTIAS
jgi:hypothetical protein